MEPRPISRRDAIAAFVSVGAAGALGRVPGLAAPSLLTRPIPRTGERIPVIGMGTWQTFDADPAAAARGELARVLERFAALGGAVVDSSPMYGRSESVVGALAGQLGMRDRLFLATKVWTEGRARGVAQMDESYRRLGVTRLDLMQVHNLVDVETHLETLAEWKAAGRVRYVGITHYVASAFPRLERLLASHDLDFVQLNYAITDRAAEARMLPAAAERGVATLINRPYDGGGLFGKVRGRALPDWAAEIDCASWGQFFLKFILSHPAVTCVIPATSQVRHLEDNMGAGRGRLPDAAMRERMAATVAEF
jgi:aryl-alcohol dehydrogenase-like predicted oxidoreductase